MFHWLKLPMFAFGFLMLFAGSAALAPHAAYAAESIQVTGEVAGGGTFDGAIVDPVFTSFEEALQLEGHLEGTATVDGVTVAISQDFTINAGQTDESDCETIYLATSPIFVDALDAEIQLDVFAMENQRSTGLIGGLLGGNAFCTLDSILPGTGIEVAELADFLNDLLGN